jgi:hypothetical protein
VARQLKQRRVAFKQVDNAFIELGDPAAAQRLADRFAKLRWPNILERYARQVNPLLHDVLKGLSHYWVVDQAEYATDLRFATSYALARLFTRLLEFALLTFSPKKIFCYLGRKWHERFNGEVWTRYKSVREPGACIKHFMKRNWLKMYDKLGRCYAWKPSSINPESSKSYGNVGIETVTNPWVGLRCAKGLATCITIKARPWPATNVIWTPSPWSKVQQLVTPSCSN